MYAQTFAAMQTYVPPAQDIPQDILDRVDLRKLYPDKWGNPVMVHCPVHKDKGKPNLGVYQRNVYCFHPACGFHEGAFAYIKRVKGLTGMREVLEVATQLCAETALPTGAPDTPLPLEKGVGKEYTRRLWGHPQAEAKFAWLKEKYGLEPLTIKRAGVGHTGKHPFAYTLPVLDLDGEMVNIRFRVDPLEEEKPEVKYWGIRGRNQALFYLPPPLPGKGVTIYDALMAVYGKPAVVLTEGEYDALALTQLGIPAISSTNGAEALTNRNMFLLDELERCKVIVCYDQDNVGEEQGVKLHIALRDRGIRTRHLTWDPRLGKDASELVAKGFRTEDFRQLLQDS